MKKFLQFLLPIVGFVVLVFVWVVSINNNGGLAGTFKVSVDQLTYNLVRLAGLTTFVLLSYQIITGTFMHLFNILYGENFYFFHSYAGILVLILASTHYALIHVFMSFFDFTIKTFSALYPSPYIIFGPIALFLLIITSTTAILAVLILKQKPKRWWRYFHYANYLVFLLVFFHSINLGTDLSKGGDLRPLWYTFFALFIMGIIYKRIIRTYQKSHTLQ
jgi:predicted ferric reductase